MASTATSGVFMRGAPPGEETQTKLNALSEQFNNFFGDLEEETAVRKKAEESRFVRIERELGRLEKAINVETRRRIEATKLLQQQFEDKIDALQHSFRDELKKNTEMLQAQITDLNEKVGELEVRMDEERENREREIQRHNKDVLEKFDAHTKEFEVEKVRAPRESAAAGLSERAKGVRAHSAPSPFRVLARRRSRGWSARRSCSSGSATRPSACSRRSRRSASSATARLCR